MIKKRLARLFLSPLLAISSVSTLVAASDDTFMVQRGIVGLGDGNDVYVISANLVDHNTQITISDTEGSDSLQLIGGLTITSSIVAENTAQLTLSNGAVITILDASSMSYILGGDPLSGVAGVSKDYQSFVMDALGVSVPESGTISGSAASVNADGSVDISTERSLPDGILLKDIPAGSFIMGDNTENDAPETSVTLSAFQISDKEITNQQYVVFLNAAYQEGWLTVSPQQTIDPCGTYTEQMVIGAGSAPNSGEIFLRLGETGGCTSNGEEEHIDNKSWISFNSSNNQFELLDQAKANWPVNWVKWYGAHAFAQFYSVDLPSEAQWEYAARGGQQLEYPTADGNISLEQANYNGDLPNVHSETGHAVEVGSYAPNPYGLYDMGGNVWEWCKDYYSATFYGQSSVEDPVNEVSGSDGLRVRRGGSWNYHAATLLTYARASDHADRGNNHFGFRVVKN